MLVESMFHDTFFEAIFFFFSFFPWHRCAKEGKRSRTERERERERDESRVVAPVSGHEIMKKKTEFGGRDLM